MVTAPRKLKDTCSLEEKLWKPRQHIKKQRHHFAKGLYRWSHSFPVFTYECESWTIKKAEPGRTDAFELWCWRRLLRVPWTARRSNQSILKEINPEYSLEGLMLMLKLQYFGHLMQRTDPVEKTLMLGKIEGKRKRGWQRIRCLAIVTDSMDMSLSKLQETVKDREAQCAAVHREGFTPSNIKTEWGLRTCRSHFPPWDKKASPVTTVSCFWGPAMPSLGGDRD